MRASRAQGCYHGAVRTFRRLAPALVLLALAAAAYAAGLSHFLSWQAIGERLSGWRAFAAARPAAAGALYGGAYAASTAVSLPAGEVLTVLGGALFGTLAGGALAVAGASVGAVLLFLAVRFSLAHWRWPGLEPLLARVRPVLERDGFAGLLALRLIPAVPFWLANLAPAMAGMRLGPYAAATVLGIAPATFVLASVGAAAGDVLARGQPPDLRVLLSARVLLPLTGLAGLSLASIAWRRWRHA